MLCECKYKFECKTQHVMNINFGILVLVFVKTENIWQVFYGWFCDYFWRNYIPRKKLILMKKNITYKTQNLYILLAFLLIPIALLIAVSIYNYLIKYQAKKNIYYHYTTQS